MSAVDQHQATRRHKVSTVAEARRLHEEGGWTPYQVARILRRRGIEVSDSMVVYWCKPESAARKAELDRRDRARRRAERKARSGAWLRRDATPEYRMLRLRALADAGLSRAAVGKVLGVDFGEELTEHEVTRALATGELPRRWREAGRRSARRTA